MAYTLGTIVTVNGYAALDTWQVYNESIKDLFVEPGRPAAARNKHDVRLDKKGRVYVEGLVECEVSSCDRDLAFIAVIVFDQRLECMLL